MSNLATAQTIIDLFHSFSFCRLDYFPRPLYLSTFTSPSLCSCYFIALLLFFMPAYLQPTYLPTYLQPTCNLPTHLPTYQSTNLSTNLTYLTYLPSFSVFLFACFSVPILSFLQLLLVSKGTQFS